MSETVKNLSGKFVAWCFISFFALIVVVNGIFAYKAVTTLPGVVTKNAYEKGLAYNDMLEKARSQPKISQQVSYDDGALRWELIDKQGAFIINAVVDARIIRPIKDGNDFDIGLKHMGEGVYEAEISLPFKGLWEARLSSKWDNKQYQTSYQFIAK